MKTIVIESGIPIPPKRIKKVGEASEIAIRTAIARMKPGDSFRIASWFKSTCYNISYEFNIMITIRKDIGNSIRVWKV